MLFQNPPSVPQEHQVPGSLNFLLFLIYIILLFAFGVMFFLKSRKVDAGLNKKIILSYCFFGIFYGMCRIFFIFASNIVGANAYFTNIAYAFGAVGFTAIIMALEKVKYKKRYFSIIAWVLTAITIAGAVLTLLGLEDIRETIRFLIYTGVPVSGILIFILYISLIKSGTGFIRKQAIYSFVGLLIMIIGIVLDTQTALEQDWLPLFVKMEIAPLLCIVGWTFFSISNLKL